MEYDNVIKELRTGLDSAIKHLQEEFSGIRAGRANPRVLDNVKVDYYGNLTPLNQMANISTPDPKMLVVSVWDKSALKDVVKAIEDAKLGVTVNDDGNIIRVIFPTLTSERRQDFVKTAKKLAENARITVRNERQDAKDKVKKMKKNSELSEDELKAAESDIQDEVDKATDKIDEIYKVKEKEILNI